MKANRTSVVPSARDAADDERSADEFIALRCLIRDMHKLQELPCGLREVGQCGQCSFPGWYSRRGTGERKKRLSTLSSFV